MFNASTGAANCDEPSFIFELKPHAKFQNPRTTPFGRKDCGGGLWCVNLF